MNNSKCYKGIEQHEFTISGKCYSDEYVEFLSFICVSYNRISAIAYIKAVFAANFIRKNIVL